MKNTLITLLLGMLLASCQQASKSKIANETSLPPILKIEGTKQLEQEKKNADNPGKIYYYTKNDTAYLIHSNIGSTEVNVFNYASGKKVSSIEADDISADIYTNNIDTILYLNRQRGFSEVSIQTSNGIKKIKIPVSVKEGRIEQHPTYTNNHIAHSNGQWYFPCYRIGEYPNEMKSGKDRFPLLEIDWNTGKHSFMGAYPEIYAQNNMGSFNYWIPQLCDGINDRQEIVMGFPASPEMLVYSLQDRQPRFVSIKSIYADSIPLPLTQKGRNYFNESESYYNYAQYSHYGSITYDPWRKLYYRFIGIGLNDWTLEPSPLLQTKKKWSVMVFNEQFEKLGEEYLGDQYIIFTHFVSPNGLYILNKDNNKSIMIFTLFTPIIPEQL